MPELTTRDFDILSRLNEAGGFPTKHIARSLDSEAYEKNARLQSSAVGFLLRSLERRGLVAKLDDQKPICWVRTLAGSKALKEPL